MRTVSIKINKCTEHIEKTTVYTFSEDSYSNLSYRIKLIDMCRRMVKTIYSSIKIQVNYCMALKIPTGKVAIKYGTVDSYWVRCGREWPGRHLLASLW